MTELETKLNNIALEKEQKIIPENIKKGVSIFGVDGALEAGGVVKQFSSIDEMNQSTGNKEGDLAVVYSQTVVPVTDKILFNNLIFPQTCVVTSPLTELMYSCLFDSKDHMANVRIEYELGYGILKIEVAAGWVTGEIEYSINASDRKTLTLLSQTGLTDNKIEFRPEVQFTDAMGQPFAPWISELLNTNHIEYEGLYEYNGSEWILKGEPVKNQEKVITDNGTYTPDAEHTGFDKVTVNVPKGVDTSDATATANDIKAGVTAYTANGREEGTLTFDKFDPDYPNCLQAAKDVLGEADVQNLRKFGTIDEMNQSTNNKEGDLAVVYGSNIANLGIDTEFTKAILPDTVVLPEAFTGRARIEFQAVDPSQRLQCRGDMSNTYMRCDFMTGNPETDYRINYTSTDGITYTKQEGTPAEIVFNTPIKYGSPWGPSEWNDAIGYFFQIGSYDFNGLFRYSKYNIQEYCICTPVATLNSNDASLERKKILIPQLYNVPSGVKFTAIHKMEPYIDDRMPNEKELYKAIDYDIYDILDKNPSNMHSVQTLSNTGKFRNLKNNGITKFTVVNNVITAQESLIYKPEILEGDSYETTYFNLDASDYISIHCKAGSSWTVLLVYDTTEWSKVSTSTYDWVLDNEPDGNFITFPTMGYIDAPTQLNTKAEEVYKSVFYGKDGVEIGTLSENVSSSFADINAEVFTKLQQKYDAMTPRILTDQDKTIDKKIYLIPIKPDGTPLLDTSNVTNMSYMFDMCTNLTLIPLLNTSNATNMRGFVMRCENLTSIPELNTSKVTDMRSMFSGCENLKTIPLLDTSKVTDMWCMFHTCKTLEEIPQLDLSEVTDVNQMFAGCTNLTTVPIFNIPKVVDLFQVFENCPNLSDESLNNILQMCISTKAYTGTRTLETLRLSQEQATKCQSLSNWNAFTAAGWTSGY